MTYEESYLVFKIVISFPSFSFSFHVFIMLTRSFISWKLVMYQAVISRTPPTLDKDFNQFTLTTHRRRYIHTHIYIYSVASGDKCSCYCQFARLIWLLLIKRKTPFWCNKQYIHTYTLPYSYDVNYKNIWWWQ